MRLCLFALLFSCALDAQFDKVSEQLAQLAAKTPVTSTAISVHPAEARVRPFETLVIQVLAFGTDGEAKVRLRRGGAAVRLLEPGGGWLSKAFAFQGADEEKFFNEAKSSAWNVFSDATSRFTIKDCFLYTAPEAPGKYRIEAEIEGKRSDVEIEVTSEAPSRRKNETVSFPPEEPGRDPYRPLAAAYAPFIAQETWFEPKADYPARFDFDGDWHGDNNWDALHTGSSQAYVYYAVMETKSHWFLLYNIFHPRDYSDRCVVGTCHENDNEGLILTVLKDGSPFGRLQVMETLAHNNVYTVTADPAIRSGIHNIDGAIEFYEQRHPAVFVESGGHGIYGTLTAHSRFRLEKGEFDAGTGVTLIYKGVAERPLHANHRLVGYDLLPIYDHWWSKCEQGKWADRTFDGYFHYQPFGGRPGIASLVGGTFMGRKEAANKAKPFWGWHDNLTLKRKVLAVGQWALDPAYAVSQTLRFPAGQPFSLDYVYNPFLGIDAQTPAHTAPPQTVAAPEPAASEQAVAPQPEPAGAAVPAGALPGNVQTLRLDDAPSSGRIEISVRVDGAVILHLQGSTIRVEVISGQPGTEESAAFTTPLPEQPLSQVSLSKLRGRGSAAVVERPSAANGFTTRIRIEDPRGGADNYRLRLEWTR